MQRLRVAVSGVVQGVGFRPFVYQLAHELGLSGFVGNDIGGVFVEIQGDELAVKTFVERLWSDAPEMSQIDRVETDVLEPIAFDGFEIVESHDGTSAQASGVPPDSATCRDCLEELNDRDDRRYRYPFIACTNCGPRVTIVTGLPYDRPFTTMAAFPLCDACQSEYDDPLDRRFHAQPTACPVCGPQLSFVSSEHGSEIEHRERALTSAQAMLAEGGIVAIKGVGGYHLAVDATQPRAVTRLRERKHRSAKPFALLVPTLEIARGLVDLDDEAIAILCSRAAPIVLAPVSDTHLARTVAGSVAPGNGFLGVMLPSSPLHHLLLAPGPTSVDPLSRILVMTSGNISDEPICTEVDQAQALLADIADGWLNHDRPISMACDDSVVRVVDRQAMPVRRSRGYAPLPIRLCVPSLPALAVGGELKTTLCIAQSTRAVMSQHIGDTENIATLDLLERTARIYAEITRIDPEVVIADAHPGYLSSKWAQRYAHEIGASFHSVQHHHAHLAALLAEHHVALGDPVLGVTFDGTGYGSDGSIWGGEFLLGSYDAVDRVGHLKSVSLPGGDAAIRRPLRSALTHLLSANVAWESSAAITEHSDKTERGVVARMIETGTSCTPTTSVGRLFDAFSSILNVCHDADYEGQAAIELEALARTASKSDQHWRAEVREEAGELILDPGPVLRAAVRSLAMGMPPRDAAAGFHHALAEGVVEMAKVIRAQRGVSVVGLTGGVFQNALLTDEVSGRLRSEAFTVLTHRVVPPNDGGLALGQIAVVAARTRG
jgi:hydrogenase maturation protein HypF